MNLCRMWNGLGRSCHLVNTVSRISRSVTRRLSSPKLWCLPVKLMPAVQPWMSASSQRVCLRLHISKWSVKKSSSYGRWWLNWLDKRLKEWILQCERDLLSHCGKMDELWQLSLPQYESSFPPTPEDYLDVTLFWFTLAECFPRCALLLPLFSRGTLLQGQVAVIFTMQTIGWLIQTNFRIFSVKLQHFRQCKLLIPTFTLIVFAQMIPDCCLWRYLLDCLYLCLLKCVKQKKIIHTLTCFIHPQLVKNLNVGLLDVQFWTNFCQERWLWPPGV